jgi:glycosyltransferase involved in cell wall biosynthesis
VKIAMVSGQASPLAEPGTAEADGQNVDLAELASALAAQDHEVTVYTRRADRNVPEEVRAPGGYRVVHLSAGPPEPVPRDSLLPHLPELTRALAARLSRSRPDVVHAHFWMSGMMSLAATREVPVPVVQTFHALGTVKRRYQQGHDTSPPGRERAEQAIGQAVARTVASCTDEAHELVRMGIPRSAVAVIPCGVDLEAFQPGSGRPAGGRPRIVAVGRLVARKGFDQLIRALRSLPDTELVIAGGPAGGGQLDRDPEVKRLRALAKRLKVRDRVRLLGPVRRTDLPDVLRSADIVACAPWYEPFGRVPLEAMACGVPVVVTAVGGMTDTVVDEVTGLLVPPYQPAALLHALERVLGDQMLRESLGVAGADRARSRYSWDRAATETVRVYEEVTAETRNATAAAQ